MFHIFIYNNSLTHFNVECELSILMIKIFIYVWHLNIQNKSLTISNVDNIILELDLKNYFSLESDQKIRYD